MAVIARARSGRTAIIALSTALWLAAGGPLAARNGATSLVTDAEAAASAKAFADQPEGPPALAAKAFLPGSATGPTIEVLAPRLDVPTSPPFDVRVVAHPRDGLSIDRSSIRVRYGFFRIDVTQRMLALGHWQGNEFIVSRAQAPKGTHWFYVSLTDSAKQVSTVAVKVVVQ